MVNEKEMEVEAASLRRVAFFGVAISTIATLVWIWILFYLSVFNIQ